MAKPKAKSQAEKDEELRLMMADAAAHNDLEDNRGAAAPIAASEPASTSPPAPSSAEPTTRVEQKGENASVAPAPEPTPTAAVAPEPATPAAPDVAPVLTPATVAAPAATAPVATPAPGPAAEPAAAAPNGENVSKPEPSAEIASEPTSTVEAPVNGEPMSFDLASLFVRSTEKKTFSMRIPDRHYQYLLVLGTMVGAGASPPDIIYNLVEQFIEKHDAQVQKAIQKQMRQRTKKP